jgi:hypothetical protein
MRFPNYTLGLFTGFCLAGLWFLAPAIIESFQSESQTPKSNFEVMDTYKGCQVLRWTGGDFSEYKYFLHCPS